MVRCWGHRCRPCPRGSPSAIFWLCFFSFFTAFPFFLLPFLSPFFDRFLFLLLYWDQKHDDFFVVAEVFTISVKHLPLRENVKDRPSILTNEARKGSLCDKGDTGSHPFFTHTSRSRPFHSIVSGPATPAYVLLIDSYGKVMVLFSVEDRPFIIFSAVIDPETISYPSIL